MRVETRVKIKEFTPEEIEKIQSAIYAVWDEVAYDCLQATAEEKGKDVEQVTVSRRDVVEISLDAGRPEQILKRDGASEDLLARWEALDYEGKKKVARAVFPYSRYGL